MPSYLFRKPNQHINSQNTPPPDNHQASSSMLPGNQRTHLPEHLPANSAATLRNATASSTGKYYKHSGHKPIPTTPSQLLFNCLTD